MVRGEDLTPQHFPCLSTPHLLLSDFVSLGVTAHGISFQS